MQCLVSFPVAWFYKDQQLIMPICIIALVYLMIPIGQVQAMLIRRENRLNISALANTVQVSVGNLMTAVFALLGLGMWAVILPKVLTGPIWVLIQYYNHPWRPPKQFQLKHWQETVVFGKNLLGVELLETLRNNLDYLIVARFISVESLGMYYFAFNAGLGISLSFTNAISSALFPYLCDIRMNWAELQQRYYNSFKTIAWIIIPVVLLQVTLAPLYVPIVFGQKWVGAIPILMLICLSAIPRPFAEAAGKLLLAVDRPQLNLIWSMVFTAIFTIGLLIGVQGGVIGVACAVLLTHWLVQPLFTLWVGRFVFQEQKA
nr:oligosaccharide flippase family protein [Neosynechococcus sphagnicola]